MKVNEKAPEREEAVAVQRVFTLMVAANELLPSARKLKCVASDLDMLLAHASRSLGLPDDIFMSHAAVEGSTASTVEAITRLDDVPAKAKVMLWRRVGGVEQGREPGMQLEPVLEPEAKAEVQLACDEAPLSSLSKG